MTLGSFPCPGVFHGRQLPSYFSKGHLCSKGKAARSGFSEDQRKSHNSSAASRTAQITWSDHMEISFLPPCFNPFIKKDLYCVHGKKLTFGCMPLEVQPKKRHSCSTPLAFNHNIAQAHGRSQSKFPQRQTIMGNCSQKSHKVL